MAPSFQLSSRLENIVCGWKGHARGQTLRDLHQECASAAAGVGMDLVPAAFRSVRGLDRAALKKESRAEFRAAPVGRFDCALVPRISRSGKKEWLFVVEADLPITDQIALYGHAIGHLLLNRDAALLGQPLPLNVYDGRAHADTLAELRLLENTRDVLNRRVLDRFPRLAGLLAPHQRTGSAPPANLSERIKAVGWPSSLLFFGHDPDNKMTPGRVFITPEGAARGRKSWVDVLLRGDASLPLAVAFALRPRQNFEEATQNLLRMGRDQMGVPFGFLVEEDGPIYEWDWTPGQEGTPVKLVDFPTRTELLGRFLQGYGLNDDNARDALLYPYTPSYLESRRYYQEKAINRAIIAVLQAKRGLHNGRILLNLATGTGKTPVAAQIAYKLKRTRSVKNILFLTDRDFLLGQAQDIHFERFGDARARVLGAIDTAHDVIFSTYQALMGDKERPALYLEYPQNWFDLIFIDECHRGSADDDSDWHKILKYFDSAIQIGMTATPRKDDNTQTYAYFGTPVATYSLRQGISDGFLAPYLVRRVEIGDENSVRETDTSEINREALRNKKQLSSDMLEKATEVIAKHLCDYLRATDPLAKTIVFCNDQAHALTMRDAIRREMAPWVEKFDDYAIRITASDAGEGKRALGKFCNVEEASPVVVTTSRLLSTGVDVETCKNVVIARPVGSFVEFKQILGRGTRLREPLKWWFTLIDYAGSIKHFFDPNFDGDPESVRVEVLTPRPIPDAEQSSEASPETPPIIVTVVSSDENPDVVATLVEVATTETTNEPSEAPAAETSPVENEAEESETVEASPSSAASDAPNDVQSESGPEVMPVDAAPAAPVEAQSETPPILPPESPVQTTPAGRKYAVVGEWRYELAPDGTTLRTQRYADYTREALQNLIADEATLRERWLHRESRAEILAILGDEGVQLSSLAASLNTPDADRLDLLAHVLFGAPLQTRAERAEVFLSLNQEFLVGFAPAARATLEALLEKYRAGNADDLRDTEHLKMLPGENLPRTLEMVKAFGGGDAMRAALAEMEKRLYA